MGQLGNGMFSSLQAEANASALGPSFVVIDFETANESRNSACAIGVTVVEHGQVADTHHFFIRPPELRFSPRCIRLHGITPGDVEDAPSFGELWPELFELIHGRLVVAHSASFDMSVLRHSLHSASIDLPYVSYLCSCKVARATWPQLVSHSLGFLAAFHQIELDHHQAASDSRATAHLMLLAAEQNRASCLVEMADAFGVTIGELFSVDEWTPSVGPCIRRNTDKVEIELPDDYDIASHPFHQMNIVFTGMLAMFTREDACRIVERFGGNAKPRAKPSTKTNLLVTGYQDLRKLACGQEQSSSLVTAMKLREAGHDIRIITDADFSELVFSPMREDS